MRILILGAGGIGGYYGGRLVEAGKGDGHGARAEVTFLVRHARAEQLAREGLVIESPCGDFRQGVNTITTCEGVKPPDIIFLTCKAYALDGALDAISPCVGPETVILPLLNGVAHFHTIEQRFPDTVVWGGTAHIAVTLDSNGAIKHLNKLHMLIFGPRNGEKLEAAEGLLAAFAPTPVDARLSHNIVQALWDKLVFLATLAGGTCLMRASIGMIVETSHGRELILALLEECRAIAGAEGFAPDADRMARYQDQLTEVGSSFTSSMLRDIQRGGPTETEHIIGDMVSRALKHQISASVLRAAYTHLQIYEAQRS